jgi:hypothetical protein
MKSVENLPFDPNKALGAGPFHLTCPVDLVRVLKECKELVHILAHGPVATVPDYRSRGPGSIPGATRFSEK